jgi:hypothetical protein
VKLAEKAALGEETGAAAVLLEIWLFILVLLCTTRFHKPPCIQVTEPFCI